MSHTLVLKLTPVLGAFARILELANEKLDDGLKCDRILFLVLLSQLFGLHILLIESQLLIRVLALEDLWVLKNLFMLLAEILAVPIDLQHLLVEIRLPLLDFRLLLQAVLQLLNFEIDLL